MLGTNADEQVEEAVAVPVDDVELRSAATVATGGGVDAVRLDSGAVLIAEFFAREESRQVVAACAPVEGKVEVKVLGDDVGQVAVGEVPDSGLLPPRADEGRAVGEKGAAEADRARAWSSCPSSGTTRTG